MSESNLIKYDYQSLTEKCIDNKGCFVKGELFDRIGANSISFEKGYFAELNFSVKTSERNWSYYKIVISQDGAELKVGPILPKKKEKEILYELIGIANKKLIEVQNELNRYSFEPKAYELWSDNPEKPYYIEGDGRNSLCNKVVRI